MEAKPQNDRVLRFFKDAATRALGSHLRQVVLFGSRARGDGAADSDYDLLVVVDKVDTEVVRSIDEIAGQALVELGAVIATIPITEDERASRTYSPLLINVAREGVAIWAPS